MTHNAQTIRFEVHINGERLCVAGMSEYGVLVASLDWVIRRPDRKPSEYTLEQWSGQRLELRVGGSDTSAPDERDWTNVLWAFEDLNEGDELTIRILGPGEVDEPLPRSHDEHDDA